MNNTNQDIEDENFFTEEGFSEDEDIFEEIVIIERLNEIFVEVEY